MPLNLIMMITFVPLHFLLKFIEWLQAVFFSTYIVCSLPRLAKVVTDSSLILFNERSLGKKVKFVICIFPLRRLVCPKNWHKHCLEKDHSKL